MGGEEGNARTVPKGGGKERVGRAGEGDSAVKGRRQKEVRGSYAWRLQAEVGGMFVCSRNENCRQAGKKQV